MVYPDAVAVFVPTVALTADGGADLVEQIDTAAGVGLAVFPASAFGRTSYVDGRLSRKAHGSQSYPQ
jgi:hypothetical protein